MLPEDLGQNQNFLRTSPGRLDRQPRSPDSPNELQRNFGNSWVTSWATSTSKELTWIAHNQEESKESSLYAKNSSNSKDHQIESDSREIWGQSHQPKRHKVLICYTQQNPQEIVLKTPPWKSQQRAPKITTKKDGKSTSQPWGTTLKHLYIAWRFVQGLACHPYTHPSL
jgi:hypothetical protein